MSDSEIIIYDHTSLIQLNEAIDYCGDSLLKLLKEVDEYLQSVMRSLEKQKDYLKEQSDRAEVKLRTAESALSQCEGSQRWDEEGRCYRPSCNAEKNGVESARKHYYDCKKKYDNAYSIVSECKYQIEQYKQPVSILSPGGAEKTLEYLAKNHTDEANRKLNAVIADVEDYLDISHKETGEYESLPSIKVKQLKAASEKVKDKQKSTSSFHRIADANVSMVCPGCKKPTPICICARMRQRI